MSGYIFGTKFVPILLQSAIYVKEKENSVGYIQEETLKTSDCVCVKFPSIYFTYTVYIYIYIYIYIVHYLIYILKSCYFLSSYRFTD